MMSLAEESSVAFSLLVKVQLSNTDSVTLSNYSIGIRIQRDRPNHLLHVFVRYILIATKNKSEC